MSGVDVVDYVATIKRAPNEQSNLVVIRKWLLSGISEMNQ